MFVGVDIGSRSIKAAAWQDDALVDYRIEESGFEPHEQARVMVTPYQAINIVATGYGRHLAKEHFADQIITEIKAHGMGVHALLPSVTTVVDVGGQDSKVISLDTRGKVANFQINSMCTVFAESEVISMKNRGIPREQIARAVHSSVADRIIAMLNRLGVGESVAFSGGVAKNSCVVQMVRDRLGNIPLTVPENPIVIGALGAAIAASRLGEA